MKILSACNQRREERGASSAEYALLITLIAVVIIAAVTAFGMGVNAMFDASCGNVSNASGSSAC